MVRNVLEKTATLLVILACDGCVEDSREAQVLGAAGWRVRVANHGHSALELLGGEPVPTLIVADARLPDMTGEHLIAAIRGLDDARSAVPVVARALPDAGERRTLFSQGFDGVVASPCTAEQLLREAETWRPDDAAAALARLQDAFGAGPIRSLAASFATMLEEALSTLDRGEAKSIAHQVAGIAGTLGFGAAGDAWRAVEDDDGSSNTELIEETARRQSRRALAVIALL